MEKIENKIEKILSNPESISQIMSIASAFLGKDSAQQNSEISNSENKKEAEASDELVLKNVFSKNNDKSQDKLNLLMAVKPFLNQPHRNSIDRAVRIMKIAKTAQNTLNTLGGAGQNV